MEISLRYAKNALLSGVAFLSLLLCQQAAAAGTLQIEQRNVVDILGSWTLTFPNGVVGARSQSKSAQQAVTVTQDGTYTLNVNAPSGAITVISLYENDTKMQSATGGKMQMNLSATGTYRLLVNYSYDGIIRVGSEPEGMPFNLVSPYDISLSGVTPAVFYDLPSQYFIARFEKVEGCVTPKPQKRTSANEVAFFGRYDCTAPVPVQEPAPEAAEEAENTQGKVVLDLKANKGESIPGDAVLYTIEVKNFDKRTQENVSVSFQFDPSAMHIVDVLPDRGTLRNERTAVWEIPAIYAGRTWSVSFLARMLPEVQTGKTADATARVSGDLISVANSTLSDTVTVGIAVLPATGKTLDLLFLLFSAIGTIFIVLYATKRQETAREEVAA